LAVLIIGGELADALAQLLNRHLVLVEVEAEGSLIRDVAALRDVEAGGGRSIELLGHLVG